MLPPKIRPFHAWIQEPDPRSMTKSGEFRDLHAETLLFDITHRILILTALRRPILLQVIHTSSRRGTPLERAETEPVSGPDFGEPAARAIVERFFSPPCRERTQISTPIRYTDSHPYRRIYPGRPSTHILNGRIFPRI